jgi:hypothetical protein
LPSAHPARAKAPISGVICCSKLALIPPRLCALLTRITNELPDFPEGAVERANAYVNLRNIRFVLARRDLTPG